MAVKAYSTSKWSDDSPARKLREDTWFRSIMGPV